MYARSYSKPRAFIGFPNWAISNTSGKISYLDRASCVVFHFNRRSYCLNKTMRSMDYVYFVENITNIKRFMILKQRSNVPGIVLWLAEQYSRNHSSTFLLNFLQCFLSEDYKRWTAPPLQQISNLLSFLLPCDWSEIKVEISGRCIEVFTLSFEARSQCY